MEFVWIEGLVLLWGPWSHHQGHGHHRRKSAKSNRGSMRRFCACCLKFFSNSSISSNSKAQFVMDFGVSGISPIISPPQSLQQSAPTIPRFQLWFCIRISRESALTNWDQAEDFAWGVIATTLCTVSECIAAHWRACIPPMEAPITQNSSFIPSTSSNLYWDATISLSVNRGNWVPGCSGLLLVDEDQLLPRASVAMIQYCSGSNAFPWPMKNSNLRLLPAVEAHQRTTLLCFDGFLPNTASEIKAFCITSPDSSGKSPMLNLVGFNSMKF